MKKLQLSKTNELCFIVWQFSQWLLIFYERNYAMQATYPTCCGVDVHKSFLVATIIKTTSGFEPSYQKRRFSAFNNSILEFKTWLLKNDCHDVCMESTGKYWVPVFNFLEDDINVTIANPKWVKAVKGNKDDTKDSKWIGDLFRLGLVYLGGNEKSTHQYISEMLGKSTIDKRSTGETRGVHGSASRNYDVLGRELMTPDEVRNMSNKKCLIFIKGFNPIFDDKYIPFRHKNFSQTEDGGGKAYIHDPSLNQGSLRPVKLLSEKQINDIKEYKKENEVVHIMDMSLEEVMMLDDTKRLYFENSNESESSSDEGSAKTISRTDILENMSEQELMDEITNRMCMMDFSREQIEEITKSLDAHMKLSILLSYLYPTTSAEEMAKKRNEHLSKRD